MSQFQIFTQDEVAILRRAGTILADCLRETAKEVRPGVTTASLDAFAEKFIRSHEGATPAFKGYRNYPFTLCTSVNEECVHGLPGPRILKDGDIISLDGGVMMSGLYTDACISVGVGNIAPDVARFLRTTEETLEAACAIVKPGTRVGDVSALIQEHIEGAGYKCVNGLTGHGLGKTLHQFPDIPNVGKAGTGPAFPAWTMVAIEPITTMGDPRIVDRDDGWTIAMADGSLAAHFEHTILLTEHGHEILA